MGKKLQVGIVGLGRLGSVYASYFLGSISNATLVAVADVLGNVAESFAREHGIPNWYNNYQDLIADSEVEAVVIVTPTSLHKDVSVEAALAGKAVFCEKPL